MSLILFAGSIVLLAIPRVAQRWGRRLCPSDWARISMLALVAGAAGLEISLLLTGLPTVLRSVGVHDLVVACKRLFGELTPGGSVVGWVAAIAATLMPLATVIAWRRSLATSASMHVEPWIGEHGARGDVSVVMLPTDAMLAYSVARPSQQVVISQGMHDRLDPEEVEAVLRHELAHLRHHHARVLVAADAVERVLPILRSSTASVRSALERWADEDAAASGPRARTAVHDALARVAATIAVEPAIAAFANVDTIVDRLDALAAPPSRSGWTQWISTHAAAGAGVMAATALGTLMVDARMVASMVGFCRM